MSRTLLQDLKARQIAFLKERLVSDATERAWREHLPAGWAALLATRLGDVADAAAVSRAVDAGLTRASLTQGVRPAAAAALAALAAASRTERAHAGDYVPISARPKINKLLEQPKLIPERLIREVMESDAVEGVMRDMLYDALKEFSEKVNPFFADWGLPALLKRLAPFGFAGVGKSVSSVRADFERRLEPEIRRFLQGFSRRAARETSDAVIARGDQPEFIALRRRVAAWLLEQEISELARSLDDAGSALAQEIVLDVIEHNLGRELLATRRRAAIDAFFRGARDMTIGEILKRYGVTITPDFDAIAAATWPLVRSVAASAPAQAWLEAVIAEFFDGLPDDLG